MTSSAPVQPRPRALVSGWLVLAAVLVPWAVASAQSVSSLNDLKPLAEGRARVDVVTGERRATVRGTLLQVSESALVLDGKKGATELPAAEVREVWNPGGPRFLKPVVIGTAVGLGVGLLAKAGDGDCSDPTSSCAVDGPMTAGEIAIVTSLGTATGLGWAWWKRQPKRLLYRAPEPSPAPESAARPGVPEAAAAPSLPAAADVRPDWLSLGGLHGRKIEVAQRGKGTTVKGPLITVRPEAIEVLVDAKPLVIARPEVEKVWKEPRAPWWIVPVSAVYFGTIPGALIALPTCTAFDEPRENTCAGWTIGATVGVVGSTSAYLIAKQRREALVYNASRPVPVPKTTLTLQPVLAPHAVGVRGALTF